MKLDAKVTVRNISPDEASDLLQNPWPSQRRLKKKHVDRLVHDMNSGEFRLSSDCILLVCGKLANGQHRLQAVATSGKAQPFIVMESNDSDLYKIIDSGVLRSARDTLIGTKYATATPAIARLVMAYQNYAGSGTAWGVSSITNENFTRADIINYCLANACALDESVEFVSLLYTRTRLVPLSIGAAVHYIASCAGFKDKVSDFLRFVYTGEGGSQAGLVLRNRMIANMNSKAKISTAYTFAIILRALIADIHNTNLSVLRHTEGSEITEIK